MAWLPDSENNFEIMFIRFGRIHERDRRTDRQRNTARLNRPRLCIASRGKNSPPGFDLRQQLGYHIGVLSPGFDLLAVVSKPQVSKSL